MFRARAINHNTLMYFYPLRQLAARCYLCSHFIDWDFFHDFKLFPFLFPFVLCNCGTLDVHNNALLRKTFRPLCTAKVTISVFQKKTSIIYCHISIIFCVTNL